MRNFSILNFFGLLAVGSHLFFPVSTSSDYLSSSYYYDKYSSEYISQEIEERVANGIKMLEDDLLNFKYQVGFYSIINSFSYQICGGALIHPKIVLTAAHCFHKAQYIELFKGTVIKPQLNSTFSDRIEMKDIVIHEDYNESGVDMDIALIKLPNAVSLTDYIGLIPLAPKDFDCEKGEAWVSGWGFIDDEHESPEIMHYIKVSPLLSNTTRVDRKIIFSSAYDSKNTCRGDSGGSYAFEDGNGGRYACGINAYGLSHRCINNFYRAHTSVQYFRDNGWICDASGELVGCDY